VSPVLENPKRRQPIARERPSFHLCADRLLAQLIQREHAIRQLLYLPRVTGSTTPIDQNDERVLDRGQ
jgi:hypothetical protein